MEPSSTKPYLLRALHEWCTDNGYTPYIEVQVDENTVVPAAHIQEGKIVLSISFSATNALVMGNEYIEFQARFNGAVEDIFVPVAAISAIFARETSAGMSFEVSPSAAYNSTDNDSPPEAPAPDRGHLRIVK